MWGRQSSLTCCKLYYDSRLRTTGTHCPLIGRSCMHGFTQCMPNLKKGLMELQYSLLHLSKDDDDHDDDDDDDNFL